MAHCSECRYSRKYLHGRFFCVCTSTTILATESNTGGPPMISTAYNHAVLPPFLENPRGLSSLTTEQPRETRRYTAVSTISLTSYPGGYRNRIALVSIIPGKKILGPGFVDFHDQCPNMVMGVVRAVLQIYELPGTGYIFMMVFFILVQFSIKPFIRYVFLTYLSTISRSLSYCLK